MTTLTNEEILALRKAAEGELAHIRAGGFPMQTFCRPEAILSILDERNRFREALKQIALCESHHEGDVVSIARKALDTRTVDG